MAIVFENRVIEKPDQKGEAAWQVIKKDGLELRNQLYLLESLQGKCKKFHGL